MNALWGHGDTKKWHHAPSTQVNEAADPEASLLLGGDLLGDGLGLGGSSALRLALSSASSALLAQALLAAQAVLLEGAEPLALLLLGLEATVSELGAGIDELQGDLLHKHAGSLGGHWAAQGDHTTAASGNRALDHQVVVADRTVADEATHGGDGLLGQVEGGRGLLGLDGHAAAHLVDLLVQHGTVMVTVLTSACNGEADALRVPCANAGDLAQTTVGLAGQAGNTPTVDNTLETMTLGHGADVARLGLLEDRVDAHLLLEQALGHRDLLGNRAAVDLDLRHVGLLDADAVVAQLAELGVGNDADGVGLLGEGGQGAGLGLLADAGAGGLLQLREGELRGRLPVLVVAAAELLARVVGPDGANALVADSGLAVADDADDGHRGCLEDRHGLHDLLLVGLGPRSVQVANNVGHTGLEDHERRQVGLLGGVVLGEGAGTTADLAGALAGQEAKMAVAGVLELAVRHCVLCGQSVREQLRESLVNVW
jgi:hypothetical protein